MTMFSALRPMAEQFMSDRCTINQRSAIEFDPEEGVESDTVGAEVYAGKCRIRPSSGPATVEAGEGLRSFGYFDVWLPWGTVGVELDHVLTIISSEDPYIVDRTFTVVNVEGGSDAPHRKLQVQDTLTITPPG